MKGISASLLSAVVAALMWTGGIARAQPPRPGGPGAAPRPAFSPYLNLVRPGGGPTLNYYGIVRPELQFRQSIQNLQGAVVNNQQAIGGLQTEIGGLSVTGHPTQFLNYGGYFLNNGPTAGGGMLGGRPVGTRMPNPVGAIGGAPVGPRR